MRGGGRGRNGARDVPERQLEAGLVRKFLTACVVCERWRACAWFSSSSSLCEGHLGVRTYFIVPAHLDSDI